MQDFVHQQYVANISFYKQKPQTPPTIGICPPTSPISPCQGTKASHELSLYYAIQLEENNDLAPLETPAVKKSDQDAFTQPMTDGNDEVIALKN